MPSRTYIQMVYNMCINGKLSPLCRRLTSLDEACKYNKVLEEHPEIIEEVVRMRVKMVKYAKTVAPDMDILWHHYILFEQSILDNAFPELWCTPSLFTDFDFGYHIQPLWLTNPVPNAVITIVE